MKRIQFHRSTFRKPESVECDDFSHEVHEQTGLYTLRFYEMAGVEKRLIGAEAGVLSFKIARLA